MNARTSQIILVISAFVAGLVLFVGVILFAAGNFSGGGPGPSAIGGPFTLTDQNGKPITDAALKGHPSLVFFGYTHCPDVCPTTLFDMSEVLRALGPDAGAHRGGVHHRRSGARHAGGDEGLSVELRSASARR